MIGYTAALINKIRQLLGIDRAIAYTLFSRGWQLVAGFGTVLLVAYSLTPIQQGFYYTFSSVLALQVFFELGLTYVVMQFVSHERAHLNWTPQGVLEGDSTAKARLSSLIRLSMKWYAVASGLLALLLIPAGLLFFGRSTDAALASYWKISWIWLVLFTAGNLLVSPVFSVLEGCGLIAEVARFRLVQDLVAYPVLWICLLAGGGLLALPFSQTVRIFIASGWLCIRHRAFLIDQIKFRLPGVAVHWWREVWPMQWKIALSWMSGYFIFRLFNPVLFAYFGATVAGQMGMTLTLTGVVTTLAMPWISTKIPFFGQMVATKDYKSLDHLFFRTASQATAIAITGGVLLFGAVVILNVFQIPLSQRMLAPLPFALFTIVAVVNLIVFAQASYLRAHKKEPFLVNSIVIGILTALSAYFLGRAYGAIGMAVGNFFIGGLLSLGWGTWLFVAKRREWHVPDKIGKGFAHKSER